MTASDTDKLTDDEYQFFIELCQLRVIEPSTITVERVKELAKPTIT